MRSSVRAVVVLGVTGIVAAACGSTGTVTPEVSGLACLLYYGGGAIPPHPDGASLCAPGACNYQEQRGCAPGQTCAPHLDPASGTVIPACRTSGTVAHGEACDPEHPCAAGHVCAEGACRQLCCGGDWSACPAGESCYHQVAVRIGDAGATVDAGADLCFPVNDCDVFDPNACASSGKICRVVDPTGAVGCAPSSDLQPGDPCDHAHQCGKAMICANAVDEHHLTGVCRRLCRWTLCGEPGCSKDDGVCVHYNRDPVGVGECTPDFRDGPVYSDGGVLYAPDGGALHTPDGAALRPRE